MAYTVWRDEWRATAKKRAKERNERRRESKAAVDVWVDEFGNSVPVDKLSREELIDALVETGNALHAERSIARRALEILEGEA